MSNVCTADKQGISLMNNFLDKQDLFSHKCEVMEFSSSKRPTSLAINKHLFKGEGEHEEVAMIIGTSDG